MNPKTHTQLHSDHLAEKSEEDPNLNSNQQRQEGTGNSGVGRSPVRSPLSFKGTHHRHGTLSYMSWISMLARCTNPNTSNFNRYGGRGIKVCSRWMTIENFIEDMGERPSKLHSIGRIDNDGDYTPENCRWETRAQQYENRSTNTNLTIDGRTMNIASWAREFGIDINTFHGRIRHNWDIKKALTTPVNKNLRRCP